MYFKFSSNMRYYLVGKDTGKTVNLNPTKLSIQYPLIDYTLSSSGPLSSDQATTIYPLPKYRYLERGSGPLFFLVDNSAKTTLTALVRHRIKNKRLNQGRTLDKLNQTTLFAYAIAEGHMMYQQMKGVFEESLGMIRMSIFDSNGQKLTRDELLDLAKSSSPIEVFESSATAYRLLGLPLSFLWHNRNYDSKQQRSTSGELIQSKLHEFAAREDEGHVSPVDFKREVALIKKDGWSLYFHRINEKDTLLSVMERPLLEEIVTQA
ncbi:MAG: hypothetical protein ABH879_07395 [archaeon]